MIYTIMTISSSQYNNQTFIISLFISNAKTTPYIKTDSNTEKTHEINNKTVVISFNHDSYYLHLYPKKDKIITIHILTIQISCKY
jgi:hypothetical protein